MTEHYYHAGNHGYMRYQDDKLADYLYSLLPIEHLSGYSEAIELGAGMGRFSAPLVEHFKKITLVEPAKGYAQILRERWGGNQRVTVLEETTSSYFSREDLGEGRAVLAFHLMHHLRRAERQEIYRAIRGSRARAIFVEPNPYNPMILVQVLTHPDMKFKEEQAYLTLTKSAYQKELEEVGLSIIEFRNILFLPPFLTNALLRRLSVRHIRKLEALNSYLPILSSYQVIVCE